MDLDPDAALGCGGHLHSSSFTVRQSFRAYIWARDLFYSIVPTVFPDERRINHLPSLDLDNVLSHFREEPISRIPLLIVVTVRRP